MFVTLALPLQAQWLTQEIKLIPGFNSVYLSVNPDQSAPQTLFGEIPQITEVWMYNRYLQTATFTSDPTQAVPAQDHWLNWYPTNSPKSFLSSLSQLRGGQSYLIKLATNSAPLTIHIKGIPSQPRNDWIPGDVVLAGFPVMGTNTSFRQLLRDNPEVSTLPGTRSGIFSVNPLTAFETQIRNPELTRISPGQAYWTYLSAHSHHPFPFQIIANGGNNSVQFIQDNLVSTLTLVNWVTTTQQVLRLRLIESQPAPSDRPARAGTVPVVALLKAADGSFLQKNLADGVDITLQPGQKLQLPIGLITSQLAKTSNTNSTYQALILITESSHGYSQLIPVVAEVSGSRLFARTGSLIAADNSRIVPRDHSPDHTTGLPLNQGEGLWVGNLSLNAVNRPSTTAGLDFQTPPSPATPLDVRVLLHVDSLGVSRLLHQVFFAEVSDGTNRSLKMYRNLTNLPPGAIFKSRVSAPSWSGAAPTLLTGGGFGSDLTGLLSIPFNNPLNPFVHRYHPDHDNLSDDFKTPLSAGKESFDIARKVSFYFGNTIQTGADSYAPSVPSLRFTGATAEFIKSGPVTNTPSFTVQFWLNILSHRQEGATLLLLTNDNNATHFKIAFVANTGTLSLSVGNETSVTNFVTTNAVSKGAWVHVAATYSSSINSEGRTSSGFGQVFINGRPDGYGSYLPSISSGVWSSIWVGNSAAKWSPSFSGSIHDVILRNGALSSTLLPQLMVVPQMIDGASIVFNLLGDAGSPQLISKYPVTIPLESSPLSQLVDLSSVPNVPPWAHGHAQGTYVEIISGLRSQPITVTGAFGLTRINQDPNLY